MPPVALILSTFGLIFVAELPDKTAMAALILATRFKARDVVLGAGLAFAIQTIIGVAAGSMLTLLPVTPIRVASGLGFIVFAYFAYRRSGEEEAEEEVSAIRAGRPAWLASFLVIFAAEWGDLTQLATAALVARTRQPLAIGIGAVLALWAVTLVAAYSGSKLGQLVKPKLLTLISAVLFAVIGVVIIVTALF